LFSVAFVSTQFAWVVGEDGIILHTEDGGSTWKAQHNGTDSWLYFVVLITPQVGWAGGATGVILHTDDGGSTW